MPASTPGDSGFVTFVERGLIMNAHDAHVSFKCTYNDGGKSGFVGFNGTCSDGNILRNVKTNPRSWCSSEDNACQQFCNNGFVGRRPRRLLSKSRPLLSQCR